MNTSHQQALAEQFHRLHDDVLVLPNAWDPPSARMVELAGAVAVATTSAGVAWSRGVADGGGLDRGTALDAANRVVSSVAVPVTVDIEDGYPDAPGGIEATIDAVIAGGAVGVNIEDSHAGRLVRGAEHADVLRRVMARVDASPVRLFVNARIDTYLFGVGSDSTPRMLLADVVERAHAYEAAGVHGIFVPGVSDPVLIMAIASEVTVPLNIMVGADSAPVIELAGLGVHRISSGPQLAMSAYGEVRAWAHAIVQGRFDSLPAGASPTDLHADRALSSTSKAG